jgi:hypothetical protein
MASPIFLSSIQPPNGPVETGSTADGPLANQSGSRVLALGRPGADQCSYYFRKRENGIKGKTPFHPIFALFHF